MFSCDENYTAFTSDTSSLNTPQKSGEAHSERSLLDNLTCCSTAN